MSAGGEVPKSLPSSAILQRLPRSPAAGDGRPSPAPCRGSCGSPSGLLRQRQVRGPSPAPTCGAAKLPEKQRNPTGRREGRAGKDGKAPGLREGSKFHLPRPGGTVPPRVSPPRKRCGLAETELGFSRAASPCGPAEPAPGAHRAPLGARDHWRRALRGSSPALVLGLYFLLLLLFLFCFPPPPSTHFL